MEGEPDVKVSGSLTGTVLRGAGLAGGGHVLAQLLTLGFYLALARLATPEDFGEFAAAAILVNAGLLFTESGMLAALIHRRGDIDAAASTAVVSTAVGGVLFSLIALALSPLVGVVFDSSRIGALAAAQSGLLLLRSLQVVPEALMQRRFAFVRRLVIEPLQVVAFGTAAVIATSDGLGPWGLVIGFYAAATTDVILSWALVRWRPRLKLVSFELWRELISYARHVLASNIMLRLAEQVPTLLLGRYVSASALGQYRYADRISSTPFFFVISAASYVIFPAFARISDQRERFVAAFRRSLRMACALAFPLGMILIPIGVPTAVVVFGETWRDAGYAAMALAPVTGAATITSVVSEALKAEGRPQILVAMHTVAIVAGTAAMLALLSAGLIGVVIGLSIGTVIAAGYALKRIAGVFEVPPRELVREIWPPIVASIAMAAIMLPVDRLIDPASHATVAALALLAGEGLACLGLYALALVALAPDTVRLVRGLLETARNRSGQDDAVQVHE